MLEFHPYVRKPFSVEAVLITEENLEEVAEIIGEVKVRAGKRMIQTNRRVIPTIGQAYPGWWLTKMDNNFRCYSPKAFSEQFDLMPNETCIAPDFMSVLETDPVTLIEDAPQPVVEYEV